MLLVFIIIVLFIVIADSFLRLPRHFFVMSFICVFLSFYFCETGILFGVHALNGVFNNITSDTCSKCAELTGTNYIPGKLSSIDFVENINKSVHSLRLHCFFMYDSLSHFFFLRSCTGGVSINDFNLIGRSKYWFFSGNRFYFGRIGNPHIYYLNNNGCFVSVCNAQGLHDFNLVKYSSTTQTGLTNLVEVSEFTDSNKCWKGCELSSRGTCKIDWDANEFLKPESIRGGPRSR